MNDNKKQKETHIVYTQKDDPTKITEMYSNGFLAGRKQKGYFYSSRSLRINLDKFKENSENRRVLSKVNNLKIGRHSLKQYTFSYEISKLATDYFQTKFGKKIISTQKLKDIFQDSNFTHLLVYKINTEIVGYCITLENNDLIHYAYPFYKKDLIGSNIGMGMMILAIQEAKKNNKKYIYLGTVYDKTSKYKLQFEGAEWFNEGEWNNNINLLKEKINNENK